MRSHTKCLAAVLVLAGLPALAAGPVAKIASSAPFKLRGANVPVAGSSAWPVLAGDQVATGKSAATLTFRDGTRVTLAPGSQAVVEQNAAGFRVRLTEGSLSYKLAPRSNVSVSAKTLTALSDALSEASLWVDGGRVYYAGAQNAGVNFRPTPTNLGLLDQLRDYEPGNLAGGQGNNNPPPQTGGQQGPPQSSLSTFLP